VQAVGSGLCGQQLRARDESALEVAPPDRWLDRRPTAFMTMRYTNRQPLPLPSNIDIGPEKKPPVLAMTASNTDRFFVIIRLYTQQKICIKAAKK